MGKTGTKEALRAVLAREGEIHASTASLNNQWGVPLSLSRMPTAARFAVFEIGMNHAGNVRYVQASRRNIGGNQHAQHPRSEASQRACAVFLLHVTGKRCDVKPGFDQCTR